MTLVVPSKDILESTSFKGQKLASDEALKEHGREPPCKKLKERARAAFKQEARPGSSVERAHPPQRPLTAGMNYSVRQRHGSLTGPLARLDTAR